MQKEKALRLKELHATSRSRALAEDEQAELDRLRRALHDGYVLAQRLTLAPGQMQRRSRRVAHALKATLVGASFRETTATMNLSSGGFAALLTDAPVRHERVEFTLQTRLGRLHGKARAVSAVRRDRSWLASFAIDEMPDGGRQALDQIVFEQVVSRLPG
ncbi:MAG TPA: PilZ domain-containing protein [Polyangiaceae bacterium]|jgi:hypothetical protein